MNSKTLLMIVYVLLQLGSVHGADIGSPIPIEQRVSDLETRVTAVEKRLGIARTATAVGSANFDQNSCTGTAGCECWKTNAVCPRDGQVGCRCAVANRTVGMPVVPPIPAVVRAAPTARASYVTGQGHTHTCPRCGVTWDHGANPSHNCPNCGTYQNVQDSPVVRSSTTFTQTYQSAPVVTYTPRLTLFRGTRVGSGGCANGQCGR